MICALVSDPSFSQSVSPWSKIVMVTASRDTISPLAMPKAPRMLAPSPQTELVPFTVRVAP